MLNVSALRTAIRDRALPRQRGWRFVLAVVALYLIRDLVLYVALPALIWVMAK